MKKAIIYIISLVIVVIIIVSFIDVKNQEIIDGQQSNMVYSINNIPNDLSRTTELSKEDENLICATSRSLVKLKKNGEIENDLAEEINISQDGIEYEIKLKDNLRWSDGSNITCDDVLDFIKELIKVEDESSIGALFDVFGVLEYKNGSGTFKNNVAITSEDNKIKIRLNKKNDRFLYELTKPQYRLRKSLPLWSDIKTYYKDIIYSGTFSIGDIQKDSISLVRNEGTVAKIIFKLDESSEFAMAQYEINNRDIVIDPPKNQLQKLNSRNRLIKSQSSKGVYLILNNIEDSTDLIDKRRKIYKGFCDAIKEYDTINPGYIEEAEGSYFIEDKNLLEKLQRRKVYMNEKGIDENIDLITVLAEDTSENRYLCEFLKDWYNANCNIEIRYTLVNSDEMQDIELRNRYHVVIFHYNGSGDRKNFYKGISGYLSENEMKTIETSNNEEFLNVEERLFNEFKVVPLYFYNRNIAVSEKVSDISIDGNGNIIFESIE